MTTEASGPGGRYLALDLARSLALLAMVIFHLTWNLAMFGWIAFETPNTGFFWYFARLTAGSFLFLAGAGLWLSHGKGIRWPGFFRRLTKILLAAALVTIATYFAVPGAWVFFGILHSIAFCSLLGLAFLRLSAAVILLVAAAVFTLPWVYSDPAFGGWLIWTGLAGYAPLTVDFEPVFPWFAPFLAGLALAKLMTGFGLWPLLQIRPGRLTRALAWPGQHSLAVYLLHQPLLLALVAGISQVLRGG